MKKDLKYKISALMFIAASLTVTSCEDWTEVESLEINTPSFEEQNPQLYEDYINDLKRYKSEEHKVTFVSFENPKGVPSKQAEHLTAIPDSVDFICLNNPANVAVETQNEMEEIRKKGTRTVYMIDYKAIESAWEDSIKANPSLTEEAALSYIVTRTEEQIAYCDNFNFDGIVTDYFGHSLVSLNPEALSVYNARQQAFFGKIMDWKNSHEDKTLVFYGNVQYLVPENMTMLEKFDYIMLKTMLSSNGDDYALKAYLALQAGEDATTELGTTVNPVPSDRFIICVELPQADDKEQVKGYWNILDENGEKIMAAKGAAEWMKRESVDFTRKGIFIMNVHSDYYNNTYENVREIIHTMNPNN